MLLGLYIVASLCFGYDVIELCVVCNVLIDVDRFTNSCQFDVIDFFLSSLFDLF